MFISVHFFAVLGTTPTRSAQIRGLVENMNTRRRILLSPSKLKRIQLLDYSSPMLRDEIIANWFEGMAVCSAVLSQERSVFKVGVSVIKGLGFENSMWQLFYLKVLANCA